MGGDYPIGKAQKIVLDLILPGNTIQYWATAEKRFEEFGITVASRRQGRTSVPVVSPRTMRGGVNEWGEGESDYSLVNLTPAQRAALAPYWKD